MLASAEVGTLITALGCGIGRDEFDADKLRYHRIIIMTDADVDGSHIRTLLLTFFYRQMPELIARGHIYIGQPPLYKIKLGKQEHYLKDDAELNEYLLARALDNASLRFDPDAPPLQGPALEQLMRDFLAVQLANLRLAKRYDQRFLDYLVDFKRFSNDMTREDKERWCATLGERLNVGCPPSLRYSLAVDEGDDGDVVLLHRTTYGVTEETRIRPDFFKGAEYRLIGRLADTLHGLVQPGAVVIRGKSEQPVSSFREAHEWLMAESRKGRTIQRFKGLGEMNPDQLWETTVNPETRRLLQVTIEDAVAADQIFTTLMGDEVEPRREFIERFALDVSNLDV
jgi:DNA gyrase subunit B